MAVQRSFCERGTAIMHAWQWFRLLATEQLGKTMSMQLPDPQYPIVLIDTDEPITAERLKDTLVRPGITLLIRSKTGDPKRGGYYFQIECSNGDYVLHPLDQKGPSDVYVVSFDLLLKLINHMSGRRFDKEAMLYVRHVIDMRADD